MNPTVLGELKALSEKIAGELVFAEAGKDLGLLPVNSLLGQMEELLAAQPAPTLLSEAMRLARGWVDGLFESTGTFSAASLKRLGEWTTWLQNALSAITNEQALPPIPAEWSGTVIEVEVPTKVVEKPVVTEEPALVLNLAEDAELLGEFINESQEHLQNIEQGVLVLEENPADAETLDSIFRAFHTFKGGSGFLNLEAIQTLAHELESLLDLARQHKLAITPEVINLILAGGDTLKQFTGEIGAHLSGKKNPGPIIVPTLHLLGCIRAVLAGDAQAPSPAPLAAKPSVAEVSSEEIISFPVSTAAQEKSASKSATEIKTTNSNNALTAPANAIKVDTRKLDALIDLVGELVIAQSIVIQNRDLNSLRSESLTRDLAQLGHISKDLQRTAMSLRMVPIRATFQKMHRLVRDLMGKVGKQVELVTTGEDTELDRTIVEEISDPLVHMIRNSVDHGLEKPEVRLQRGKPAHGTVFLKAFHQGGNIVIEIKDDGSGLDRERILAKAREKGLVKPDEQLTDNQVFNLIFAAGFSTAEKVTDLSGRGVGLDVVRRNIDKLRGKIDIQSTPGQGATFSIYLPLTLAIIDGLLVGVGEHRYILPTLSVCESFQPRADMIKTVHGRGELINVRGRLIPLLRLYSHLGIQPATTDATQSIVVVVEAGKESRCILADQLLGKQEVVIKSLGEAFRGNRCLAGAAILGDGRVGLILDPQALVHPTVLEAAA
ncbi:MAG TPA: chemotaxis protein CheA [Verrucomicrobiae bacterium]|nr:chemotaxis protein CheA [Verrucomicrobiae bacterium]